MGRQGTSTGVGAQEAILRACSHPTDNPCLVDMGHGEKLPVCVNCWNAGVAAQRADRKQELAKFWAGIRAEQETAMQAVGARIGQRVSYFLPSALGAYFGGITLVGTIVTNRNGIAVVRLDRKFDGHKQAAWNKGWKEVQS